MVGSRVLVRHATVCDEPLAAEQDQRTRAGAGREHICFQGDARAIERRKGRAFGQIRVSHRAKISWFYKPVEARISYCGNKRARGLARRDRMLQWFSSHWPAELPWPNQPPHPCRTAPAGAGGASSSDYTLAETVTIPANQTSVTTTLRADDDTDDEPNETVRIEASATGYDPSPTRTVTIADNDQPQKPVITSINPALQWLDYPVTIYGNHFGSTPGSVWIGGHTVGSHNFTGSNSGYSWSNASISLLIPGSLYPGHVSVTVRTHNGMTSAPYFYTITDNPVQRGECDGEEDCPEEKEKEESEESGETEEDPAEGGG